MSPTIVFDRDGRAVLALGSAGGKRIIMHVTKTLIGVIDFGLPLDQAIALPNIYFGGGGLEVEQNTMLSAMSGPLSEFGQKVRPVDLGSKVNGAQRIGNSWTGASDPRSEGTSATIDANGKVHVTVPRLVDEAPTEDVG
jgi:gamma-glutamyltranspeptidase/glutathione hydrolase